MKKRATIAFVVSLAIAIPVMGIFLYYLGALTVSTNQEIDSLKANLRQNCMQLRTEVTNQTTDQIASREHVDPAQLKAVIDECKSNGYWFNSTTGLLQR